MKLQKIHTVVVDCVWLLDCSSSISEADCYWLVHPPVLTIFDIVWLPFEDIIFNEGMKSLMIVVHPLKMGCGMFDTLDSEAITMLCSIACHLFLCCDNPARVSSMGGGGSLMTASS
jgi:hypothetical protein